MIYCNLYDGGTEFRTFDEGVPGMLRPVWIQQDYEGTVIADRLVEINENFKTVTPLACAPWPEDMPGKMWIDHTSRYAGTNGGLALNLYSYDPISDDYPALPGGVSQFVTDPEPELDRGEGRLLRSLDWEEVQAGADDPTEWVRLPARNEYGGTDLHEPLTLQVFGNHCAEVALELPDNSLFAPFDFRELSRYRVFEDGVEAAVSETDKAHYLRLRDGGTYALYLKPRRWRWFAEVECMFVHATPWWSSFVIESFNMPYWDRPPVYPYRHSILSGDSSDIGIDYQFTRSRAAAQLRENILDTQYVTLCEAYVYVSNDPAKITIWRYPHRGGEFVAGIGRIDKYTGHETRVWVQQVDTYSSVYPIQQIAYYEMVQFSARGI